MNDEMIEVLMEAMDNFKREIMPETRRRIIELQTAADQGWARKQRIAFLKGVMSEIIERLFPLLDRHGDYLHKKKTLATLLVFDDIKNIIKKILKLQLEIFDLRSYGDPQTNKQTPARLSRQDIERAREFPFSELIEIQRNNMAICPFHEDHDPSFHVKNNYGRCFGCGWSGDTISFVMQRDGKSFAAAVRSLL